jgi:hypothetical protein
MRRDHSGMSLDASQLARFTFYKTLTFVFYDGAPATLLRKCARRVRSMSNSSGRPHLRNELRIPARTAP